MTRRLKKDKRGNGTGQTPTAPTQDIRILQFNMDGGKTAYDLALRAIGEKKIDLLFISEPYQKVDGTNWYPDTLGRAAIWVANPEEVRVDDHGAGEGFAWVRSRGKTYISAYLSPNGGIDAFQRRLDGLEDFVREQQGRMLIAGDFNAKALEWGEPEPDSRGKKVMEMAARADLVLLNVGSTPTFRRPGCRPSILDITLATEDVAARIEGWEVLDSFTSSYHSYITFVVKQSITGRNPGRGRRKAWNAAKLDKDVFYETMRSGLPSLRNTSTTTEEGTSTETVVETTMRLIHKACDASMPLRAPRRSGRPPAYWWTDEIAELRRICHVMRRKATRARRNSNELEARTSQLKRAKKDLKRAIFLSKQKCWDDLRKEIDRDPWGKAYKIVMGKLSRPGASGSLSSEEMERTIDTLFPSHPPRKPDADIEVEDIPYFTSEELTRAAATMKNRKAPGPDGIPAEAIKEAALRFPRLMLNMYNSCIETGIFSQRWKRQRLVLIDKGKGGPRKPNSFRPLCMLDTAGKLLEKMLKPRLHQALEEGGGLADRQFGFRPGRSTVDAVREVVQTTAQTKTGNHRSRNVYLVVTLDIKNAFNSLRWDAALEALRDKFKIPGYLLRILQNYLKDRTLLYETDEGQRCKEVTAGAAQGAILGPDLWNAYYDKIFRIPMPDGCFLNGYADDIAAIIEARDLEHAKLLLSRMMLRILEALAELGLELALEKIEILVITTRRIPTINITVSVGDLTEVKTAEVLNYLGITLDGKLTFSQHIKRVSDKAARVVAALSRIMANTRGPKPSKRKLLMSTVHSILLYGAEIWADALETEVYRKRMASVQRRGALRITCAYRTVSEPAALLVAGVAPIDLLAKRRKRIYDRKAEGDVARVRQEEDAAMTNAWRERLANESRGEWTRRLIPDLHTWINRPHGEVNYHLTQFLTGHGLFESYLHRMALAPSPRCRYCPGNIDDVHHTFFDCPRWTEERSRLTEEVGEITPDNIITKMVTDKTAWSRVDTFAKEVMTKKKKEHDRSDATLRDQRDRHDAAPSDEEDSV